VKAAAPSDLLARLGRFVRWFFNVSLEAPPIAAPLALRAKTTKGMKTTKTMKSTAKKQQPTRRRPHVPSSHRALRER
jgi:hypothetical protein